MESSKEQSRLEALYSLNILDTEPEMSFNLIVQLAARLCKTPVAAVCLVDKDRVWIKAECGINAQEVNRDTSFCNLAIEGNGPLVVHDATADIRFASLPSVTGVPFVRAYIGIPIQFNGMNVGTLCVVDQRARKFDNNELHLLKQLAERTEQYLSASQVATLSGEADAPTSRYAHEQVTDEAH